MYVNSNVNVQQLVTGARIVKTPGRTYDVEVSVNYGIGGSSAVLIDGVNVLTMVASGDLRMLPTYTVLGSKDSGDPASRGDLAIWNGVQLHGAGTATYQAGYTLVDGACNGSITASGSLYAASATCLDAAVRGTLTSGTTISRRTQESISIVNATTITADSVGMYLFAGTATNNVSLTLPQLGTMNYSLLGAQFRVFNKSASTVNVKTYTGGVGCDQSWSAASENSGNCVCV